MSEPIVDPGQEKAILHTAGPAQIIAGPGSGKTFVIVHRIRHLITYQGVDPARILVITFTKAAALEMQERFFRLMKPEILPVRFGTFHAVFYHILKQSARYRGYSIMTESDKRKQIRQIIRMYNRFSCLQEEDLEELITFISAYKTSTVRKAFSVRSITEEDVRFIVKEYEAYQQEFGQMDFDDIMVCCRRLLAEEPETLALWREQFQYILVDEFQDISPMQYEIVRLLAAPEQNLFIVGDDDQSIYGFRGASPDSMQRFRQDFPDAEQILLDRNYRCHKQIVESACRVIGENHNRIGKRIHAVHEDGEGFRLCLYENEREEQEYLANVLHEKQEQSRLGGCALICRTNYDCAMWAQVLRRKGIPFSMKEIPGSRFSHFVNQDIMAYLMLADGVLQRKYMLRILNRPVRYLKRDSLPEISVREEDMLRYYQDSPMLQERIRKLFRDIGSLHGRKLYLQIHYIRNVIGYDSYLRQKYGPEKAEELVRTAADFQEFSRQFQTLQEMREYIEQYEETLRNAQQERKEKRDGMSGAGQRISLLTAHASKGLEFDTVYVPDCQEGKLPSAKSVTEAEIEEERRMFYVAMTRARKELWVMACKGRTGKDAPSRFLNCLH